MEMQQIERDNGDQPKSARKSRNVLKPAVTKFKQQQLKAWQPIFSPFPVITTFLVIGIIFLPIGVALLIASIQVTEVKQRYDNVCPQPNGTSSNSTGGATSCTVYLNVPEKMGRPVYLYYKLEKFYQNHRRYVGSRSDTQLRGKELKDHKSLLSCTPVKYVDPDLPDRERHEQTNFLLPCGLVAWSTFNDTFTLTDDATGEVINATDEGIAWPSDKKYKFKNPNNFTGQYTIDPDLFPNFIKNERFIVWMRTAALPTFRKPYGIIKQDIPKNTTVRVDIDNRFPVHQFDGRKWIVLSTNSWAGGKNHSLGIAYIVVGGVCLVLGLLFLIIYLIKPRKFGDPSSIKWNRPAA